jgi:two-component system OmpR family sensor kinase
MTETTAERFASRIPAGIIAFGIVLLLLDIVANVTLLGIDQMLSVPGLVGRGIVFLFCGGIVASGLWLRRSGLNESRYPRIALWVVTFAVVFLAVNLTLIAIIPAETFYGNLVWALFAIYVGSLGGIVVGIVEARAINRAVRAERAAVRAEQIESQRRWLDYLNSLLRHEVLNNAGIIQGYASLLLDEEEGNLSESARDYLQTIHQQSRDMTEVVRDVRILLQATEQVEEFSPVDIESALTKELSELHVTYDVETSLTVDDDPRVEADDLLPRIFSNLLSNAVEHNPSDTPRVDVRVDTMSETVHIEIEDNGPGIPDGQRSDLFERGHGDHGLGLYLVEVLVDRYDGSIELTETGPDGTVFTIELPRATDPSGTTVTASDRSEPKPGLS